MNPSVKEWVALSEIPGITGGEIRLVWEPSRMTEEGRRMLGFF